MGHLSGCMGTNGNSRWLHGDGAPARSRHADRWCGIERPYTAEDVERLRGSVHVEHTLARRGAERLWELIHRPQCVRALGRADRQPGGPAGQGGPRGDLPLRLAGRRRREPRRPDVPRPEPVPGRQRARTSCGASTRRCSAPTRSTTPRGDDETRLVRADRRRRRGGLRRRAERLRADEGDDRGGRRGRALRGPARLGEEVRAHGRQGAACRPRRSSATSSPRGWPPTCSACRRSSSRAPTPRPRDLITSDVDPRDAEFLTGERTAGGLLPHPRRASTRRSPAAWPTRPTPTSSGARPRRPDLERGAAVRRGDPRALPRQAAGLQLLALVQLEGEARPTTTIARFQRRARRRWATASSS